MLNSKQAWKVVIFYFSILFILIMAYIAGSRKVGLDNDSLMYAYIVKDSLSGNVTSFLSKEPGFWLIVSINKLIDGDVGTFFTIYAFFALCIKVWGIAKVSPSFFSSIILYVGFYFIVHEMMQIRIGLASGFIFFTFYFVVVSERLKSFFVSLLSIMFHYSTVIALFMLFLKPDKRIGKLYIILPVAGLIVGTLIKNDQSIAQAFFQIMPEFLSYKASLYFDLASSGRLDEVKPIAFGFGSIIYFALMLVMYFRIKKKDLSDLYYRSLNTLLKITSIQLFLGFLLMFNVEFSNRIYTYLGVLTFTILPAFLVKEFKFKYQAFVYVAILIYAARQLYTSYTGVFG